MKSSNIPAICLRILAVLAIALVSLLLFLPVVLSTLTTSIPKPVWILLCISFLLLSIVPFRIKPRSRGVLIIFAGFIVINLATVFFSQIFAKTPPITDENGKPLAGSIATLEQVDINGSKQWITIRGKDMNKPVLLYLGIGGPGAGGMPATFTSLKPLEDHFVVVNWDQPGTGKSYNAVPIHTLTPQRFVEDAKTLTEMMRQRFHKEKVYVMGLSWGTIVGIELVKQYPDLFYAYVGNGQMVNTTENDRYGYDLALKITSDRGDLRTNTTLKRNGQPPYEGKGMALKYAQYNNVLFDYMDSPNLWMIMSLVPQLAREYGYIDKINFDRGLIESFQILYPQLKNLDFSTQAANLEVPIYFIVGRKDVNAVASIVERYYNVLQAPYKELVWLESGHGATAQEIEDAFVNHVLANQTRLEEKGRYSE